MRNSINPHQLKRTVGRQDDDLVVFSLKPLINKVVSLMPFPFHWVSACRLVSLQAGIHIIFVMGLNRLLKTHCIPWWVDLFCQLTRCQVGDMPPCKHKKTLYIVSLETMAYYDIAHKSMLGWYVCLIHDFVMRLPQHTRSSSINQLTIGLQGIQPAYPPCIPTLPKHSSEARACTRATGWAPPIWYSELLHSTEYQLVVNPLDYLVLLGCWAQSHSYKNTLISVL